MQNEKKQLKKMFKNEETAIREIFHEWDLITSAPTDEYDCLIHNILSLLHQRSSLKEIRQRMIEHLDEHFGVKEDKTKVSDYAEKIWDWWIANHVLEKHKPINFCCERLKQEYMEGKIVYAYENTGRIDETEWIVEDGFHIYYCPFCGAFLKGYGWGAYDDNYPPNKGTRIITQQ